MNNNCIWCNITESDKKYLLVNGEEWAELKSLVEKLEAVITKSLGANMFNWSCLMNDFYKSETPNPHLHIHVRPRYNAPITIKGKTYNDEEYAHHYDNHKQNKLTEAEKEVGMEPRWALLEDIVRIFSKHEDYKESNAFKQGMYYREYLALEQLRQAIDWKQKGVHDERNNTAER